MNNKTQETNFTESENSELTLEKIVKSGTKLTPMMEQYFSIKQNYPDTFLLFRMGDFYEVFFEDAKRAARLLNITLTHRGKLGEYPIPMAGMPHHAASTYIDRLTGMGLKVAICEQVENPKDAQGSIVRRAVTQIVSPALPYDVAKTEAKDKKPIVAIWLEEGSYSIVSLDFTTGEFYGEKLKSAEDLLNAFRLIGPSEFLTFMGQFENESELKDGLTTLVNHHNILKTHLSSETFSPKYHENYIEKLIPGYKRDKVLKSEPHILNPISALAFYIQTTQALDSLCHIRPFKFIDQGENMKVSIPTLIGLEIFPKARESRKDSLLGFFDRTKTALGARSLKGLFLAPLRNLEKIEERHKHLQFLLENSSLTQSLRDDLENIRDIERILVKVSTGKVTGSDLLALSESIFKVQSIDDNFSKLSEFSKLFKSIDKESKNKILLLAEEIKKTINDEIGAALDKGNLINKGVSKERDRLARLAGNHEEELSNLEEMYRQKTGIQKLRVKSNNAQGFFIEISKSHTGKAPKFFERRQTLTNAERYTTDELIALEKEITSARFKLEKLEREIFKSLTLKTAELSNILLNCAEIIGHLDAIQSFAKIAETEKFVRPSFDEKNAKLHVVGGFHPLIRSMLGEQFIAHDLVLDQNKTFGLITGPNMAGKTTVMREMAIIQFLAQIGSFVPAQSAELGLCDHLFSRLGASDDILKGQSTFMVEMSETAEILRHATDKSLIILDEVGRGTSTYDGLSIAWALVEYFIHETKALTLFATHYHELIDKIAHEPKAKNLTVETSTSKNGEVNFLYRLVERGASQSFGLYVAKLAGLPKSVLDRGQEILNTLESEQMNTPVLSEQGPKPAPFQLSFFEGQETPRIPEYLCQLEDKVKKLDVMRTTPLEALHKLQELKNTLSLQ